MGEIKLTYSEAKMLVKLRDEFMSAVNKWDGVKWKDWHANMLFDQLMKAYKAGGNNNEVMAKRSSQGAWRLTKQEKEARQDLMAFKERYKEE